MAATITRTFDRWSYPKNGNTGNPTPYWRWVPAVDGRAVNNGDLTLAKAKAFLADYFGETDPSIVREPPPPNPWTGR